MSSLDITAPWVVVRAGVVAAYVDDRRTARALARKLNSLERSGETFHLRRSAALHLVPREHLLSLVHDAAAYHRVIAVYKLLADKDPCFRQVVEESVSWRGRCAPGIRSGSSFGDWQ